MLRFALIFVVLAFAGCAIDNVPPPTDPFPEGTVVKHVISGTKGQVRATYFAGDYLVRFVNDKAGVPLFEEYNVHAYEIEKVER